MTASPSRTFLLPALRSRNYRLFFAGQGISLIGTWMTQVATIWLVYHLTQSAFLLGFVGFASQIPTFLITPFGGVVGDRWHRRSILVITQVLSMVQSLALAVLTLTGTIQVWQIIVLALFQGAVNAIDAPTRQAFVSEMVERREDLPNAIALNSSMFNSARLLGPAIAGGVIAVLGAGACFLIDGVSYVAVILALLAMRVKRRPLSREKFSLKSTLAHLREGYLYAYRFLPIRSILLLLALVGFMGMQYTVLLPIFATDILGGDAATLGLLTAASGIGALAAGIYLSLRKSVVGLGKVIGVAPIVMSFGLIGFACSRQIWLSTLMMGLTGVGFLLQFASSNTLVQTLVDDDKRGRVMSLYIISFLGMVPLGSLVGGTLAGWIGAPMTIAIDGVVCILGALLFLRQLPKIRQVVRPIYRQRGLLPEANP